MVPENVMVGRYAARAGQAGYSGPAEGGDGQLVGRILLRLLPSLLPSVTVTST